jgi:phage-related protein
MLDIPGFVAEKNKLFGKAFLLLLEIKYDDADGGQYVRWFQSPKINDSITFEGVEWTSFGFSAPKRSQNSRGEISAFDIAVANVSRAAESILQNYILENRKGRLVVAHRDHLADPTSKDEEFFMIKWATTDEMQAVLTCASVKFATSKIPRKLVTRSEYPGLMGFRARYF